MTGQDDENPLVVSITALMAISGVAAMRIVLGYDYRHWAVAYLAMGLTASIRRTSAGSGFSAWSALRGVACLVAGLYASQLMGYPMDSLGSPLRLPDELEVAVDRLR
jgi:hypothetical protein